MARKVDLYEFLRQKHGSFFKVEGNSIRLCSNNSISIKKGYSGYVDFATGEHGNSVDFLVKYMNYSVTEAVFSLIGDSFIYDSKSDDNFKKTCYEKLKPVFPKPSLTFEHMFAYLNKIRGISKHTIQMLIDMDVIYEYSVLYKDKNIYNIAFVNKEKDFAEIHGTNSFKSFHGIVENSRSDGFWWFKPYSKNEIMNIYICEAAIDAISLYEIHKNRGCRVDNVYVSIAGCGKQNAVNRLKSRENIILAVDNDEAGQNCRIRNSDLSYIVPVHKDWNEDLLALKSF